MGVVSVNVGAFDKTANDNKTVYGDTQYFNIPANNGITGCTVTFVMHKQGGNTKDRAFALNGSRSHASNVWPSSGMALDHTLLVTGQNTFRASLACHKSGDEYAPYSAWWKIGPPITLNITYNDPYSACTPPTSLSFSANNVGPSASVTLSWSGASQGTNNPIVKYSVYRSTSSGGTYTYIGESSSASMTVTSHASNGSSYFYKVITVGSVAGYNSGYSVASAGLKTVWTNPSISNVKIAGSASNIYAVAGSEHRLSWDSEVGTNNAIISYTINRNGSAFKSGVTNKYYDVNAHSTSGSSYYYSVVAVGAISNSSSVNSPTMYSYVACDAPTSVSVAKTNVAPGESVTLSWSGAKSGGVYNAIEGYEVHRSTSAGSGYTLLDTVNVSTTSGSLAVTAPSGNGNSYYYKIITLGERANSSASSYAELKCSFTAPSVSGVSLSKQYAGSGETVTLSWNGSNGTNNNVVSYTVLRGGSEIETGITGSSFNVSAHATAGSSYQYAVKAIGQYSDGSSVNAPVLYTYGLVTAPSSVSVFPTTTDAGTSAMLSWSGAGAASHNDITGYDILRATSSGGTYSVIDSYATSGTSGSKAVTAHATMGSKYYYKVRTVGQRSTSGNSASSAELTSRVYTSVTAPTTVSVSPVEVDAGTSATLSWSGAGIGTNNPITGYRIYRSTSAGSGYSMVHEVFTSSTSGSKAVMAHATMGSKYYYKVETVGSVSGFDYSGQSSVYATLSSRVYTAVGVAGGVSITAALMNPGQSVRVSWNAASNGTNVNVDGYDVYKSVGSGAYSKVGSVSVLYYDDMVGASGTKQNYKIITKGDREGFDSGFSSVVSVTANTAPSSISNINISPMVYEAGNIMVSFNASSDVDGNLSHYQVQRRIQTSASGWGSWTNFNMDLKAISFTDSPSVERGYKVQYRVRAHDLLGLMSAYVETAQAARNTLPSVPSIVFPANGKITFNVRPYVRVVVASKADATVLTLQAKVGSGSYKALGTSGSGGATITARLNDDLAIGVNTVYLRVIDALGAYSADVSVSIERQNTGYFRAISSGSVIARAAEGGLTKISHQAEIEQMYDQINEIRDYVGLSKIVVPELVGENVNRGAGNIGMFAAWGNQMQALQTGLNGVRSQVGLSAFSWQSVSNGMHPKADVLNQIRSMIGEF